MWVFRATKWFEKSAKKLTKKYSSLGADLQGFKTMISQNPEEAGVSYLGKFRKVRLAITSKDKGKSSGARVILYFVSFRKEIYLMDIYDKSDKDSLDKTATKRLQKIVSELVGSSLLL